MVAPYERYVYKPFLGSSHSWALGELDQLNRSSKILDIGSGSGAIGRELKERGFTNLTAVEIDPESRKHVTSNYTGVHEDITLLLSEERKFDVILLLDIIEHLADPQAYLSKIAELTSPGALILISVPNVAHWSIRASLLAGFFEYTERGILDRTHLHFFTARHLKGMLSSIAGLELEKLSASIVPLELLVSNSVANSVPFRLFAKLRYYLAQALIGLCGFQLLAKIHFKPSEDES